LKERNTLTWRFRELIIIDPWRLVRQVKEFVGCQVGNVKPWSLAIYFHFLEAAFRVDLFAVAFAQILSARHGDLGSPRKIRG